MNIFVLDFDPKLAAQYHHDKHVVKMILESAQLLCAAHHLTKSTESIKSITEECGKFYKLTHKNHPCTVWAYRCLGNYKWLVELALALLNEYYQRFGSKKAVPTQHNCCDLIHALEAFPPENINKYTYNRPFRHNNFVTCMPHEYKIYVDEGEEHNIAGVCLREDIIDTVESYRNYYRKTKVLMSKWSNGVPPWI